MDQYNRLSQEPLECPRFCHLREYLRYEVINDAVCKNKTEKDIFFMVLLMNKLM